MNVSHPTRGPRRMLAHLIFAVCGVGAAGVPMLSSADTSPGSHADAVRVTHEDDGIVRAVRTRLQALHLDSVTDLQVVADADGMVRLKGTAATQEAADRAIEAARNADGVEFVKADIVVARTVQ